MHRLARSCPSTNFTLSYELKFMQVVLRRGFEPAPTKSPNGTHTAAVSHTTRNFSTVAHSTTPNELNILHFNDVYNLEPRNQEPVGGAAKFVQKCREAFQEHNALVLFSGDAYNPSLMSTVTKGAQMPPVLNRAQVQAAVVGNHDLDFGPDRFAELASRCDFPWLLANLLDRSTGDLFPGCKRYHVLEWAGIRVGIMGLVEREWLATMPLLQPHEVLFLDTIEEGRQICSTLREAENVDVVIALTHMRTANDMKLMSGVPDIDLILGGHDHEYEVLRCKHGGPPLIKSGTDFRDLSLIRLRQLPGGRWEMDSQRMSITDDILDDPETAALTKKHTEELMGMLDRATGPCAVPLDGRFHIVRTQECNLGNLVTDIALFHLNGDSEVVVDCVLLNGGTFRSDSVHQPGQLKRRDLVSMLPLLDDMVVVEVSGEVLLRVLENGVAMYPTLEGRILQVSNMSFSFDPSCDPGHRILKDSVEVAGRPLDPAANYVVGTKAYLVQGKDGFDSFADCKIVRSDEECQKLPLMVSQFFEVLNGLNSRLADGLNVSDGADAIEKRVLKQAEVAAEHSGSSIVRFFPEQNLYMADPAIENRWGVCKHM